MKGAYVDTSCLAAIAFGEPGSAELASQISDLGQRYSSNLLEAELRAAFKREETSEGLEELLDQIAWILPDRPLAKELRTLTDVGNSRGADLWHLACALFLDPKGQNLAFASLDQQQRSLARRVGFEVLPA